MSDENQKEKGVWKCVCRYFTKKETVRETIEDLIEEAGQNDDQSTLSRQEQLFLNNILYLRDKRCRHVMVPRAEIDAFPKDGSIEDLLKLMIEKGHSKIPIYGESLDDIVGMIHMRDVAQALINGNKKTKVENLMNSNVKFVSPSMHISDLLSFMQKNKMHMALVIDEYGGVDGLVTIEDLLEEIVGDIQDEYDVDHEPDIICKDANTIIADASAELDEIKEKTGIDLCEHIEDDESDVDTLGGLVCAIAERLPQRGEVIEATNNLQFRVLDVDSRRIKKVMIVIKNETKNPRAVASN